MLSINHISPTLLNQPLLVALALLWSSINPTIAASFDCTKKLSETEAIVCRNHDISVQDDRLNTLYKELMYKAPVDVRNVLKLHQGYWINKIRNQCASPECIREAYVIRADKFRELLESFKDQGDWKGAMELLEMEEYRYNYPSANKTSRISGGAHGSINSPSATLRSRKIGVNGVRYWRREYSSPEGRIDDMTIALKIEGSQVCGFIWTHANGGDRIDRSMLHGEIKDNVARVVYTSSYYSDQKDVGISILQMDGRNLLWMPQPPGERNGWHWGKTLLHASRDSDIVFTEYYLDRCKKLKNTKLITTKDLYLDS